MPLRNYGDDDDRFPDEPPSAPPPEGAPPYQPEIPEIIPAPTGNSGGAPGGSGWGALNLPPYPAFNIPGAPAFTPTPFKAPSMADAQNEPGYQFRVDQGTKALERSAAAKGTLRTGGTLTDLVEYGQNFAAAEYSNVFNRALASYDRTYRAEHDAYAPKFATWQMRADADKQAQIARHNAQLTHAVSSSAPRNNPMDDPGFIESLLPELPPMPGQAQGAYGAQGYPWTSSDDRYRLRDDPFGSYF